MTLSVALLLLSSVFPLPVEPLAFDSTSVEAHAEDGTIDIKHGTKVERRTRKPGSGRRAMKPAPRPEPKYCGMIDARSMPRTCHNGGDTDTPAPRRNNNRDTVQTHVQTAVRTLKVPALTAITQPGDQALINIPTILYTTPVPFTQDVTLLGQTIRIEAQPAIYRWHHGDNTSQTTRTPGRPYPNKDITHTYRQPQKNAEIRVDTSYRIRYRLPDGTWHTLPETLTITGPTTTLTINEARPYLTR